MLICQLVVVVVREGGGGVWHRRFKCPGGREGRQRGLYCVKKCGIACRASNLLSTCSYSLQRPRGGGC